MCNGVSINFWDDDKGDANDNSDKIYYADDADYDGDKVDDEGNHENIDAEGNFGNKV